MNYKLWLQSYFRHPLQLGAIVPSGAALSSLMARHLKPDPHAHILELGSGTGSFTQAILKRGIPEDKLVLIEKSAIFANFLQESFPKARIICGDAKDIASISQGLGINEFDEIISGIPLNAMGHETRRLVFRESFKVLKPGGSFVQVSYLPRCSIPNDIILDSPATKIYCGVSIRNLPPAFVWRVRKDQQVDQPSYRLLS